jgi:hypothetical protein
MDDLGVASPFAAVGDFGQVNYAEMNKGVQPIFFTEPVRDDAASERDGVPRYRDEERVQIIVAGDQFNRAVHPVDDAIKARFPEHYARWQATKKDMHIDGTPLKQWPLLSPAQVAEFSAINILSVEMLAELSDANVSKIFDGRIWREKAKAWLEQAKDGATATRYAAENERLKQQVDALTARVNELANEVGDRRGPGRPPKQAA